MYICLLLIEFSMGFILLLLTPPYILTPDKSDGLCRQQQRPRQTNTKFNKIRRGFPQIVCMCVCTRKRIQCTRQLFSFPWVGIAKVSRGLPRMPIKITARTLNYDTYTLRLFFPVTVVKINSDATSWVAREKKRYTSRGSTEMVASKKRYRNIMYTTIILLWVFDGRITCPIGETDLFSFSRQKR